MTEGEKPILQKPKTSEIRHVRYLSFRRLRRTFLIRGRQGYGCSFSWLHLMVRTEDPAVQGFGSAVLESVGFAPAGRGLQAARDC